MFPDDVIYEELNVVTDECIDVSDVAGTDTSMMGECDDGKLILNTYLSDDCSGNATSATVNFGDCFECASAPTASPTMSDDSLGQSVKMVFGVVAVAMWKMMSM